MFTESIKTKIGTVTISTKRTDDGQYIVENQNIITDGRFAGRTVTMNSAPYKTERGADAAAQLMADMQKSHHARI